MPKLPYEHIANGRRNLGRPRKRWRKQHPCKIGQNWNGVNLVVVVVVVDDDDDDDDGDEV
jgi:hypothetical protein